MFSMHITMRLVYIIKWKLYLYILYVFTYVGYWGGHILFFSEKGGPDPLSL